MTEMTPPWDAHPDIPAGSIGWRMGRGEEYLIEFDEWFARKHADAKQTYADKYPEPRAWNGFYSRRS
jgi:hypothetical protein